MATLFEYPGVLYAFLKPSNLLGAALLFTGLLMLTPFRRLGKATAFFALTLFFILKFSPLESWLIMPLEERFPPCRAPSKIDGIIVLGGALDVPMSAGRAQLNVSGAGERILAFHALAARYPELPIVYTGGASSTARVLLSEAEIFEALYAGEPRKGPLIFEKESRTTEENARLSRKRVAPAPEEIWLLVTSAWHMPRAVAYFRASGWRVVPYPVDYRGKKSVGGTGLIAFPLVDLALKEWLGMAVGYLMGKTKTFFPTPDRFTCNATAS